ncbi:MAG: beta-N-acetylhexosaminidase, partial [Bacteroidetes bacterium]|nr:beta-N-acetylhexosaminidase [Bacteroidota bacterium]
MERRGLINSIIFVLFGIFNIHSQLNIIPSPTNVSVGKNNFSIPNELVVNDLLLPEYSKELLIQFWTKEFGKNLVFASNEGDLIFSKLSNVPRDFYSINIDTKIRINYSSDASCFYALQTLFQVINKKESIIPFLQISDEPNFEWRGMHLDVSRHFYSVQTIKKYLDLMSVYKLNTFHWHLTDDQGWRIEIRKYPLLTSVGARRDSTLIGHASEIPKKFDYKVVKEYYTQKDIRELVEYAAKKYITVVPEIEMPGHASAAIAAYPELGCKGFTSKVESEWGVFDNIFCSKTNTMNFIKDVLAEVCDLFPGKYIHIGGDEVLVNHWERCADCKITMEKNGLKETKELQGYFLSEMDNFLTQRGKNIIGWDEILEGGLSPNAAVMSWRGEAGGVAAAQLEHSVVMSPTSHCYFDHYQSNRSGEPLAIGGYLPLSKVFDFQPIPSSLIHYQRTYVKGGQANLWTEYIKTEEHLDYMIFPRLLAMSEVLWSKNKSTFNEFSDKLLNSHLGFLTGRKVNFSKAFLNSAIEIISENNQSILQVEPFNKESLVQCFDLNKEFVSSQVNGKINYVLPKTKTPQIHEYTVLTLQDGLVIDSAKVVFMSHSTNGDSWIISKKPSTSYAGKGSTTLTDGILGARPWNGKDWLGFQEDTVAFQFNFLKNQKRNHLYINFLQAESSWIYLPERVNFVFTKKNGKSKLI